MNKPYVKQYTNGKLTNPLVDNFTPTGLYPNRAQRNRKPTRFRGNHKGVSLSITPTGLYYRVVQWITKGLNSFKRIETYILKQ